MFVTEKGSGVTVDGAVLSPLGAAKPKADMIGQMAARHWKAIGDKVKSIVHIGCAAHVYMRLAEGQLDFATFLRLYPWDNAAGTLMYEELGGVARHIDDGSAYDVTPSRRGLLMAPSADAWEDMVCDVRHTYSMK